MSQIEPLDAQLLLRRCDPALLDFETTDELSNSADIVGQSRALDAVRFGIDIKQPGFNLFVFPFLDRIRNKARLFMGIRLVVMRFLEYLKGVVDGFSLRMGVGMWLSLIHI